MKLFLLPGLICDGGIFASQSAAFPQARALDGYDGADSLGAMAAAVLRHADSEGTAEFDLLGHSMGGRVVLEVFRMAPDRVRRLALVSTGVHPVGAGEQAKRHALRDLGRTHGFAALVDEWLPPMLAPANHADLYKPLRAMCLAQGQARFEADTAALLGRQEAASLLPRITCPVLVMTGALDGWASPAQHQAIADALPDATCVIVPDAGHMLPAEAPRAVNDAIAAWLAR
ncbi:alpha/beta hydrolase [Croceibacterium sp. TMG7-5b_MA50]|uniref:alpha/beta fold hydrolase n=1 Tax=Croceibacterium sp. TMG7-5b_MA50 TaxID=3121290 RepID=UPI003221F2D1